MPNCEETCSNVISGDSCSSEEKVEGCFCPGDKVVVNGECVERSNCTNCVDKSGSIFEVMVVYGEFEHYGTRVIDRIALVNLIFLKY